MKEEQESKFSINEYNKLRTNVYTIKIYAICNGIKGTTKGRYKIHVMYNCLKK